MMKILFFLTLSIFIINKIVIAQIQNGKILFNRSQSLSNSDGYYYLSNYKFQCLQQLSICSTHGWSLRFKLYLNSFEIYDRKHKYLLFSTGAHKPHGDGILIYLYNLRNTSYLEFGLKEFHNDQYAYYWKIEIDLEINKWIDIVINIKQHSTSIGQYHQMTIFFDGYLYAETEFEEYTELYIFKYNEIHPTTVVIYTNNSGLIIFDNIIYYERILAGDEIANVSPDIVSLGCLKNNDRVHQYIIPETFDYWRLCRDACYSRRMKIAFYSSMFEHCGCIQNSFELDISFDYDKKCNCLLNKPCSNIDEWHIIKISHIIDLIDTKVGLEIHVGDSSLSAYDRILIQQNEHIEIIILVNNERNLALLTVSGDIEDEELSRTDTNSKEINITAGVLSLSWKNEGTKKVQFRADYRRMINNEISEYVIVYFDVVSVKTNLPLKFLQLSSNNRNGNMYQNFTVETFGSSPINCTLDFGDGYQQTYNTSHDQYHIAYFSRNYTRYGLYNVTVQCYNNFSTNTTQITRFIGQEKLNKKNLIYINLMETLTVTRFNLISRGNYSYRHINCLYLKNAITNETMKIILRNNILQVIQNKSLPIGKHLYHLECDSIPLQPYILNIQPGIRSLDIVASQTAIENNQSIQFSIKLEPTLDLTIIFNCGISEIPLKILYVHQINNIPSIPIGNCTYSMPGKYHPLVNVMNRVNVVNRSIRINVEKPLVLFKIEVEDHLNTDKLTLVKIQASEPIPFEGMFTLTIIDNFNESNQTILKYVKLFNSNNFTEYLYINISTYGTQLLHVRIGNFPKIREAQDIFTIGTDITIKPQVYIINPMGFINEDSIWIDIQWIDGIGFHIQIDYGDEKKVIIRYEQIISSVFGHTIKKNDGIHQIQWRIAGKQHLQVGYIFTKTGTFKINVKFIQPSSKLFKIDLKCPLVTIIKSTTSIQETCFGQQKFKLISSNSLNNINSSVLYLPYNLQHNLKPTIITNCSSNDFIYSYYLLSINASRWKYSRLKRYSNTLNQSFQDIFLENYCSQFQKQSILKIEPKSLSHGYYLSIYTISTKSNISEYRQFIQPIEIVHSDFLTTFNGNKTLEINDKLSLDFYYSTINPDDNKFDRRKLNFTLICYPKTKQSLIFLPNLIQLGLTRPTELNLKNVNNWSIQWTNLNLIFNQTDSNIQFYENQCFKKTKKNQQLIEFDLNKKIININEDNLLIDNDTLYFLLIIRHLIDNRQLITRLEVNTELKRNLNTNDLYLLENAMSNFDHLAETDPEKAMDFISNLADKLNDMSNNSNLAEKSEAELAIIYERLARMRLKMLTSMDTVLNSADESDMVDKALKAITLVTASSNQMPLKNQEKGTHIIERVSDKVKNMESETDNTVTDLATGLLDVVSNVLQATSNTVSKDKEYNPDLILEKLELDMKLTENKETDTKVLYAPAQFYDTCDECDTLPEERWEEFRHKLDEEKKMIINGRERASTIAKRSSNGLFSVGDTLTNRSSTNEIKTIESKTMTMTFTKADPDGNSSLSAGDTSIRLPNLSDLNFDSDSSNIFTKILESKTNPYASVYENSSVQGNVVTVILSRLDGSEMLVQNITKPISIRLTRPIDKRPEYQRYTLNGTSFQYHKINLPDKQMTLSIYISPDSSPMDIYGIYVSYGINETTLESPTESKFDLVFSLPNKTLLTSGSDINANDEDELKYTLFMPPNVHLGNGTYIFGVKLINANTTKNLTEYNSSYIFNIYVSKCQYWDEQRLLWSSDGCQVGSLTTLISTECLCTHLTTFGSDFYVPSNTINFKTVFKKFRTLHENAAVFSTVIIIFSLYVFAAIWARRKDKQDLIKWTAIPLIDNLPIDTYYYLITVHTGFGKESVVYEN